MADHVNLALGDVPMIKSRCRLQWEAAQNAHVLLYPEGMVKLSESAAEILKCVDGTASVTTIVEKLEQMFPGADLRGDVIEFLNTAYARGWITTQSR
jgi:pyrroloquinoline quinone biosynthesis protein D